MVSHGGEFVQAGWGRVSPCGAYTPDAFVNDWIKAVKRVLFASSRRLPAAQRVVAMQLAAPQEVLPQE
jgi:hypothetical protein